MQRELFRTDTWGRLQPCDPHVDKRERPRLSKQCRQILWRLEQGPATNVELASIALKYTSRLSDLRAAGYDVQVVERDHRTGVVRYALR